MSKAKDPLKAAGDLAFPLRMSNEEYHANRTHVSKSWLDRVALTPYHLRQYLDEPFECTPALNHGAAVDCLIFTPESFDDLFVRGPEAKKTTKAGKEEWEEFYENEARGRIVIEVHNTDYWSQIHEMAAAINANPVFKELTSVGEPQPIGVWRDPSTGLLCKLMADWYNPETRTLFDLKTAISASPDDFSRSAHRFRYHVQDAFYTDGVRANGVEVEHFVFGVMEKPGSADIKPDPRMLAFYELGERERELGRDAYTSDLSAIMFAIENDSWEGYADHVVSLSLPPWAYRGDD